MGVIIRLECSETEILGVFDKNIHLLTHGFTDNDSDTSEDFECVLVISESLYIKEWKKWIAGKKNHCEIYNEYCGVMGEVYSEDAVEIGTCKLNKWNDDPDQEEPIIVEVPVYKVTKFSNIPDFEHG